jgi:hypothetical protein
LQVGRFSLAIPSGRNFSEGNMTNTVRRALAMTDALGS